MTFSPPRGAGLPGNRGDAWTSFPTERLPVVHHAAAGKDYPPDEWATFPSLPGVGSS